MDAATLETIPLFAGLTLDQRERIAGVCQEIEIEAGATLLREGDFGYAMFAILDGAADVLKDGAVIRTLQPGDVFGEIAVLAGGRRTATVSARSVSVSPSQVSASSSPRGSGSSRAVSIATAPIAHSSGRRTAMARYGGSSTSPSAVARNAGSKTAGARSTSTRPSGSA